MMSLQRFWLCTVPDINKKKRGYSGGFNSLFIQPCVSGVILGSGNESVLLTNKRLLPKTFANIHRSQLDLRRDS
jgi:hypothetical protein